MIKKRILVILSLVISSVTFAQNCINSDFEQETSTATITSSNQLNGWIITNGVHTGMDNVCNLSGCCPGNPSESAVIVAPNGYTDAIIGSCYPVYSVFGSGPANAAAQGYNLQLGEPMYGTNFIRLNSNSANNSIEKLSKTLTVTAQNCLFQFAYISVFSRGHDCCNAAGFKVRLLNAASSITIACPAYSTSAGNACQTPNVVNYATGNTCLPVDNNATAVFNKWKIVAMDLTPYIGQNIMVEVIASDCNMQDHYGYTYFDATCGPMLIYGNGIAYDAGTNILVPGCGSVRFCAPAGMGLCSWLGTGVPAAYSVPSYTNGCFTAFVTGQYTLFMNPDGACAPIARIVNSTITPALQLSSPPHPFDLCGNTQVQIGPVMTGPGAGYTYSWSAPPSAVVSGINTPVLTTNAPGVYTVMTSNTSNTCTSSAQLTVGVCVGLTQNEGLKSVSIFPNPTKGLFFVRSEYELKDAVMEIYNLVGELVSTQKISATENKADLENCAPGIYQLRLRTPGKIYYLRS